MHKKLSRHEEGYLKKNKCSHPWLNSTSDEEPSLVVYFIIYKKFFVAFGAFSLKKSQDRLARLKLDWTLVKFEEITKWES